MEFKIHNRWSGRVQFTAEIECGEDVPLGIKVGLAVKWAYKGGADLRGADLRGADLRGADLSGADLRGAVLCSADLRGADLRDAVLSDADLCGADLRDVVLRDVVLRGVPSIPNIDAKILAAIEDGGKLNMDAWHTCATTHCRAGWAITLAGEPGRELEKKIGSAAAGTLIYLASTPDEPIPNFYASNDDAMADIRARAAKQTEDAPASEKPMQERF